MSGLQESMEILRAIRQIIPKNPDLKTQESLKEVLLLFSSQLHNEINKTPNENDKALEALKEFSSLLPIIHSILGREPPKSTMELVSLLKFKSLLMVSGESEELEEVIFDSLCKNLAEILLVFEEENSQKGKPEGYIKENLLDLTLRALGKKKRVFLELLEENFETIRKPQLKTRVIYLVLTSSGASRPLEAGVFSRFLEGECQKRENKENLHFLLSLLNELGVRIIHERKSEEKENKRGNGPVEEKNGGKEKRASRENTMEKFARDTKNKENYRTKEMEQQWSKNQRDFNGSGEKQGSPFKEGEKQKKTKEYTTAEGVFLKCLEIAEVSGPEFKLERNAALANLAFYYKTIGDKERETKVIGVLKSIGFKQG